MSKTRKHKEKKPKHPVEVLNISDQLSDCLADAVFRLFRDHPEEVLGALAALTHRKGPRETDHD